MLVKDAHGVTVRVAPPLVVEEEDLEWGVEQLWGVLSA